MSLGSSCYAIISPEKAFGKIGVPPKVPPNSELFLQIQIIDIESNFVPRFLAVPPERTKCISNEYIFQEVVSFSESAKNKKNLSDIQVQSINRCGQNNQLVVNLNFAKMTERSEAKSAKQSFASKYIKFLFSKKSFALRFKLRYAQPLYRNLREQLIGRFTRRNLFELIL
jgi:hypothetical protein